MKLLYILARFLLVYFIVKFIFRIIYSLLFSRKRKSKKFKEEDIIDAKFKEV